MPATVLVVEDERKLRDFVRSTWSGLGLPCCRRVPARRRSPWPPARRRIWSCSIYGCRTCPVRPWPANSGAIGPTPILMLTAKSSEEDRIPGPRTGRGRLRDQAFSPRELVLRVQAILRRGARALSAAGDTSYGGGALVIDEPQRLVTVRGAEAGLTPTEWASW